MPQQRRPRTQCPVCLASPPGLGNGAGRRTRRLFSHRAGRDQSGRLSPVEVFLGQRPCRLGVTVGVAQDAIHRGGGVVDREREYPLPAGIEAPKPVS